MIQVKDIRKMYFEEGKNISEISRMTGHDRKTIDLYLKKEDWNIAPKQTVDEIPFPKLEPFKAEIDRWLLEDRKARRKQRHTAKRVFDRLCENHGDSFNCSYRTVAGYVSARKKEIFAKQMGYLPLEHNPGEAQADFGDADFYEKSKLFHGKYLNLSFPYSNTGYFQLFKGENQECLFEGLINIFEYIGGVPQKIWFDNASTMVTEVLKEGKRNLTDAFIRFQEHYRFESAFCNLEAGHEKGSVEAKVGYHRRNMLVPIPRFESLAEFNKAQLKRCEEDTRRDHYRKDTTIEELFREDKAALLELPAVPLDVSKYITVKTNGYGKFYLHSGLHEYSSAPGYANRRILVKITADEVIPMDEGHREIVRHERLYGEHKQQSMKWLPYLTQLSKRPTALKYTGIYQMLPEVVKDYLERCGRNEKGKLLSAIASLTARSGFEKAVESVSRALQYKATDVDSLINLHNRMYGNVVELPPLSLSGDIPKLERVIPNLAAYDAGLGKAGDQRC